jgi:hypothetical protein
MRMRVRVCMYAGTYRNPGDLYDVKDENMCVGGSSVKGDFGGVVVQDWNGLRG